MQVVKVLCGNNRSSAFFGVYCFGCAHFFIVKTNKFSVAALVKTEKTEFL